MQRLSTRAVPAALLLSVLVTAQGHAQFYGPGPLPAPVFPVLPVGPYIPPLPPLPPFPPIPPIGGHPGQGGEPRTTTPIKHVVVIFGENESFDHYFGTYPYAKNPKGEPAFHPLPFTPTVNGYNGANLPLLYNNPNFTNKANDAAPSAAANPFRLDRTQAHTASMNHGYTAEQQGFDGGKMDLFPLHTGAAGIAGTDTFKTTALVMGYYDGNTVTALWNYAQYFALNDNSFSSQFGPSTVGALNLISGQTNGADAASSAVDDGTGTNTFTVIGDPDPRGDVCSGSGVVAMKAGKNIGDLLNAKGISWGWFQGGFDLTVTNADGSTGCARLSTTTNPDVVPPVSAKDYVPHHEPFQYYASTANPTHKRPTVGPKLYGTSQDTGANHQYDIHDFYDAIAAGNLPAVSFLKAPAIQNAHPSNSDPLDEQTFIVNVINTLQDSPFWGETAVILAYDDSDGWYDHVHHVINPSSSSSDALQASGKCATLDKPAFSTPLPGTDGKTPVNGRCGYGPRQPLLVVSPYAKHNFVDHTLTDQSSIIRFVEDNWLGGERIAGSYDAHAGSLNNMFDFYQAPFTKLKLDPNTGEIKFF